MIIKEKYKSTGSEDLVLTYSDRGVMLRKIGTEEFYPEAIDVESSMFLYEETDIPIEREDETDGI